MENTSMRATTEYNEMLELLQLTYMKAEELCDELKQCLNKLKENKNISELSQLIHTQKEKCNIILYETHQYFDRYCRKIYYLEDELRESNRDIVDSEDEF